MFGLVPLERLGKGVTMATLAGGAELHDSFHFIYTTTPKTLTWRVQRAIEAIFYHHPNAKVIMHSRTIPSTGTKLDVFVEAVYDFSIQLLSFEKLLEESPSVTDAQAKALTQVLPLRRSKARNWYSHETDIAR